MTKGKSTNQEQHRQAASGSDLKIPGALDERGNRVPIVHPWEEGRCYSSILETEQISIHNYLWLDSDATPQQCLDVINARRLRAVISLAVIPSRKSVCIETQILARIFGYVPELIGNQYRLDTQQSESPSNDRPVRCSMCPCQKDN